MTDVEKVTKDGRYVAQDVSECGAVIRIKNAAYVADRDVRGCPECSAILAGTYGDSFSLDDAVVVELGWCQCGNPEDVNTLMLAYLRWRKEWKATDRPVECPAVLQGDVAMLLAYLADQLGWTEHGGTVHGAWLTGDGEKALANLEAWSGAAPENRG